MDLILRNARVRGHDKTVDIAINNGLIAKIAPKITARCEMDLSPGTRMRPCNPARAGSAM